MSKLIEKVVPRYPTIYRNYRVSESGEITPLLSYRVRKRVKVHGKWTSRAMTFPNFEEAKLFSKQPIPVAPTAQKTFFFNEEFELFLKHKEVIEKRALGTIEGYRNRAKHFMFFDDFKMKDIVPSIIDLWVDLLFNPQYRQHQKITRKDYSHEYVLLGAFFRHFMDFRDETFEVPLKKRHRISLCSKKKNEEIRFLSESEETDFLHATLGNQTIHDLALFQLHTGCRVGEGAAICPKDVDLSGKEPVVYIRSHLHWERYKEGAIILVSGTKGGTNRTIPLTPECAAMLRNRCNLKSAQQPIFCDDDGNWLRYRKIQSSYNSAFKKIGVSLKSTHTLRHTFAVNFLNRTKDIYALRNLLGHVDLKVTQVYAKYTDDSVRRSFHLFYGNGADKIAVGETVVPKLVPISKGLGIS